MEMILDYPGTGQMSLRVEEGGSRVPVSGSVLSCENQPAIAGFEDESKPRKEGQKWILP